MLKKGVFTCKDRCRYSRKRANFCRTVAKESQRVPRARQPQRDAAPVHPAERVRAGGGERRPLQEARLQAYVLAKLANFANFLQFFCKFLASSFSAVSKRNFARKYAFGSIFQALQDLHPFAPLQSQNFRKKSV